MSSVVFFDSGVGGIAYLNEFFVKSPYSQHYYFADTAGFPYGMKSDSWLVNRILWYARDICRKKNVDIFVIACNTASVIALKKVREELENSGIKVVGVVPAIKLAVDRGYRKIYVMGTSFTASSLYTRNLIKAHTRTDVKIVLKGLPELVKSIEKMVMDTENEKAHIVYIRTLLEMVIHDILYHNSEVVVLACTHFLHIKKMFTTLLKNCVAVIDSLEGVTNRIVALSNFCSYNESCSIKRPKFFVTSDDNEKLFVSFSKKNMLVYEGVWK